METILEIFLLYGGIIFICIALDKLATKIYNAKRRYIVRRAIFRILDGRYRYMCLALDLDNHKTLLKYFPAFAENYIRTYYPEAFCSNTIYSFNSTTSWIAPYIPPDKARLIRLSILGAYLKTI